MTQFAVHKFVGVVEDPEVIFVPRLAGLPVPPLGDIAVEPGAPIIIGIGNWANGTRRSMRARRETQDCLGILAHKLLFLKFIPLVPRSITIRHHATGN
jgi:hypothetical protein